MSAFFPIMVGVIHIAGRDNRVLVQWEYEIQYLIEFCPISQYKHV